MSLLMEALRKAEEAKRRMQHQEQTAPGTPMTAGAQPPPQANEGTSTKTSRLSLDEREPALTPGYILDNFGGDQTTTAKQTPEPYRDEQIGIQQDSYTHQTDAYVPPAPERITPRTLAKKQQRAAASVFVAKQKHSGNRKTVTILVIVMVLMLPVGGGVLWYLQSMSPASVGINPAITSYDLSTRGFLGDQPSTIPATEVPAQAGTPVPTALATKISSEQSTATAPPENIEAGAETILAGATAESEPATTAVVTSTRTQQAPFLPIATANPAEEAVADPAASAQVGVLEITRSGGSRTLNPNLVTAYNRLQSGDLLVAGQLYQEVLNGQPNNRDALLGLALVHLRQGDQIQAGELYARLVQLNPRDPLANAGLLQTVQAVNPAEQEAKLNSLLAEYPDVAPLGLALGNLYASQQRWSEAQEAYYNALLSANRNSGGSVHPDYAFNLAVSLEQLNQKKAALDYYRQAQALAVDVTPGFDPQLLNSRLAYLEQNQP